MAQNSESEKKDKEDLKFTPANTDTDEVGTDKLQDKTLPETPVDHTSLVGKGKEDEYQGQSSDVTFRTQHPLFWLFSYFYKENTVSSEVKSSDVSTLETDKNQQKNKTIQKIVCKQRSENESFLENSVKLVNDSGLQKLLKYEKNATQLLPGQEALCQLLLLYAPWCPFSAKLSPHFNALARAFPDLDALAINAVTLNYWNARFGTVSVPNILLFHNGKFISKFNNTQKNLESLIWFVQNSTNLLAVENTTLIEADYTGPVPSEVIPQTDYYLYLAWMVVVIGLVHSLFYCKILVFSLYNKIMQMFHFEQLHAD